MLRWPKIMIRSVFQTRAFVAALVVLGIGISSFVEATNESGEFVNDGEEWQMELKEGGRVERGFFDGRPFNAQGSYLSRLLLQLLLILGTPRILHYFILQHLWQPRVVSEILSGVILGPSVMGLIPGWMETVFPPFSVSILGTVASLGLVLFLFMVGLGINSDLIETEWRFVFSCVGLSAAVSMLFAPPLTLLFWKPDLAPHENEYTRGTFPEMMLFIAVLQGITATGVLARIMAERGILAKRLGGVVMATTAVNLMYQALIVAISLAMFGMSYTWTPPNPLPAGTSSPLDAGSKYDPLWICLCYAGYLLILRFPLRWVFTKLAAKAEKKKKLDMFIVWFALFCVMACGYFTQTLTLAGRLGGLTFALLSIPRVGTFPQDLRKHVEGLVMLLFMPIFYTWSGLRIDLEVIDGGDVWRVVLLMICCYVGKFASIYMGACANGMHGFKGAYFGILHATKGFAAIVICNTVYDVGLITKRMLTISISFAIVTTILVTPLIRGLQVYENWFKSRLAKREQVLRISVLNYSIVAIPSSIGMIEPVLGLVAHVYADVHEGRNVRTTALRIVNSAEMDDSFAAMYLENANEEQLRTDPLLGACSNYWRPDFRTPLQLAAITAPEQIEDTLGYIYGQGFTGDSLQEEAAESLASNCVVMDYVPSTSKLITRLVFDRHVALRLLVGQFPQSFWSEFKHLVLLFGSTNIERQHEQSLVEVSRQLMINNPSAQMSIWKHNISEENPLPELDIDMAAVERPVFEGDLSSVIKGLSLSPVPYDLILAPCFFNDDQAPAVDAFQNWIRHQADMSNHVLDELYFTIVPILLVATPDQDQEVSQHEDAPVHEAEDLYTLSGKMLDG